MSYAKAKIVKKRASGILLHITSLPSKYGIGDFGPEAYKFADFLRRAGQNYWQILPLNYTLPKTGHCPYSCPSAFAGNPLLISPQLLYRDSLLTKSDIKDVPNFPRTNVDYVRVTVYKKKLLQIAYERFVNAVKRRDFELFRTQNRFWLDDFTTFIVLRRQFGNQLWNNWPTAIRNRNNKALKSIKGRLRKEIDKEFFLQYIFHRQWSDLKRYCNKNGIQIIGDIPIYVAFDSADVWSHPEIFKLNRAKKARYIAGVPPDYFSRTGQLWANPVYDWQRLKENNYSWWIYRIKYNFYLFDLVRIDHFRGFIAYWQIPAKHKTALHGKWVDGPKEDFFNVLLRRIPSAPIIAEDLGYITADVKEIISKFEFPSMRILQFAFGGGSDKTAHILHNHVENCVVYTGTHDNNTIRGWFLKEAKPEQKRKLFAYLGRKVSAKDIHWQLIRLAMSSVARIAIIPMQDVLGLGQIARMNRPASIGGNWRWRLQKGQVTTAIIKKLKYVTRIYGRN